MDQKKIPNGSKKKSPMDKKRISHGSDSQIDNIQRIIRIKPKTLNKYQM